MAAMRAANFGPISPRNESIFLRAASNLALDSIRRPSNSSRLDKRSRSRSARCRALIVLMARLMSLNTLESAPNLSFAQFLPSIVTLPSWSRQPTRCYEVCGKVSRFPCARNTHTSGEIGTSQESGCSFQRSGDFRGGSPSAPEFVQSYQNKRDLESAGLAS